MEVLENMRLYLKEGIYIIKKHYLKKDLEFRISETKTIAKEPNLVSTGLSFLGEINKLLTCFA